MAGTRLRRTRQPPWFWTSRRYIIDPIPNLDDLESEDTTLEPVRSRVERRRIPSAMRGTSRLGVTCWRLSLALLVCLWHCGLQPWPIDDSTHHRRPPHQLSRPHPIRRHHPCGTRYLNGRYSVLAAAYCRYQAKVTSRITSPLSVCIPLTGGDQFIPAAARCRHRRFHDHRGPSRRPTP